MSRLDGGSQGGGDRFARGALRRLRRRALLARGRKVASTPLLLPAYSGALGHGIDFEEALSATLPAILGPLLVSAYDLAARAGRLDPGRLSKATFVVLDSGGYELRACGAGSYDPWSIEAYGEVLNAWPASIPAIAVSYDDWREDALSIPGQLERAATLFEGRAVGRCLLLKPPGAARFLEAAHVRPYAAAVAGHDLIAITEKEAGATVVDRLRTVASIRDILDAERLDVPLHVFGGLDPFLSPLYLLAGADVCDGLSWLRYAFVDGRAVAMQSHLATVAPEMDLAVASWAARRANLRATADLQIVMQRIAEGAPLTELGSSAAAIRQVLGMAFPQGR